MGSLNRIEEYEQQQPIRGLPLSADAWAPLANFRRGAGEFIIALARSLVSGVKSHAPHHSLGREEGSILDGARVVVVADQERVGV
jgi:hypothetical protein